MSLETLHTSVICVRVVNLCILWKIKLTNRNFIHYLLNTQSLYADTWVKFTVAYVSTLDDSPFTFLLLTLFLFSNFWGIQRSIERWTNFHCKYTSLLPYILATERYQNFFDSSIQDMIIWTIYYIFISFLPQILDLSVLRVKLTCFFNFTWICDSIFDRSLIDWKLKPRTDLCNLFIDNNFTFSMRKLWIFADFFFLP